MKFFAVSSFLSWQGLLKRSLFIAVVFLLVHFFNGREYVGGLFGTQIVLGFHRVIGLIYVFFYFLFTIVVPIFLVASILILIAEKLGLIDKIKNH